MSEVIAVYGGSFNPPHIGHTLVAAYVLAAYQVDLLLVVPAADHAFGKELAPFHHRAQMCELAMRPLAAVRVSDIEARRGGVSRTLHTLQGLQQEHPNASLRLVIGSDLVAEFPRWHAPDEIRRIAPLIVIQRSGHITTAAEPAIPEISSTELRGRLRAGSPAEGMLSPAVQRYISAHGLYGINR